MNDINPEEASIFLPASFFTAFGARIREAMNSLGEAAVLAFRAVTGIFRYRLEWREFLRQFLAIGNRSVAIVSLISFFTGLVIALQLSVGLGRFGLKLYVGQLVGLSVFRELGPVLTALMVAARVGSGIAAEIGSMVVTEQVLAIEAMGANPVQKLVIPRLLATVIALPILVTIADVIGVLGGMLVTINEAGISMQFYIDQVRNTLIIDDFVSGLIKAAFFGFFIAIISCYEGLKTTGGTEGVGRTTTRAVVFSSVAVFVSDFFLTKLILFF